MSRIANPQFVVVAITAVNVIAFVVYTAPLLFFGMLGLQGGLADTSSHENTMMGLALLAAAAAGLTFHSVSMYLIVSAARKQRSQGLCPNCGYELRSDPDSGCPECEWGRE